MVSCWLVSVARSPLLALAILLAGPGPGWAGGSHYGIAPGARPEFAGRVVEWAVPTPQFARDPAPGPDGAIYIAVMFGNRIARFDPRSRAFTEWDLPPGARPHGLLVDGAGRVWYTGNGNGTIGQLDPATGKVVEHRAPSGGDPHTLVLAPDGVIWFTVQRGQRIGRLDTRTGRITAYPTRGNPYGLALDRQGHVWFCQLAGDRLGRLDPATGTITVDCDVAPPPDVVIQIGPSANSGSFNPRQMRHVAGPDRLNYNLFTDPTRTTVWGDGTSGTATKTCERVVKPKPCSQTVYALLPAGQDVAVGSYQDVVTVTILVVPRPER